MHQHCMDWNMPRAESWEISSKLHIFLWKIPSYLVFLKGLWLHFLFSLQSAKSTWRCTSQKIGKAQSIIGEHLPCKRLPHSITMQLKISKISLAVPTMVQNSLSFHFKSKNQHGIISTIVYFVLQNSQSQSLLPASTWFLVSHSVLSSPQLDFQPLFVVWNLMMFWILICEHFCFSSQGPSLRSQIGCCSCGHCVVLSWCSVGEYFDSFAWIAQWCTSCHLCIALVSPLKASWRGLWQVWRFYHRSWLAAQCFGWWMIYHLECCFDFSLPGWALSQQTSSCWLKIAALQPPKPVF